MKKFIKGEEEIALTVSKKYERTLLEIKEKFDYFVRVLSKDIAHAQFFLEAKLGFSIDVGASTVEAADLLNWMNCIIKPDDCDANTVIQGGTAKASGVFNTVIHQGASASHLLHADEDDASALFPFFGGDQCSNFSPVKHSDLFPTPSKLKILHQGIFF